MLGAAWRGRAGEVTPASRACDVDSWRTGMNYKLLTALLLSAGVIAAPRSLLRGRGRPQQLLHPWRQGLPQGRRQPRQPELFVAEAGHARQCEDARRLVAQPRQRRRPRRQPEHAGRRRRRDLPGVERQRDRDRRQDRRDQMEDRGGRRHAARRGGREGPRPRLHARHRQRAGRARHQHRRREVAQGVLAASATSRRSPWSITTSASTSARTTAPPAPA